eukprot:CAMPEP_0173400200 /NCGR_PEP_ID=MMETSP1356-20130122/47251_1 /TAXON_ID=77927 ORGANISM="Hemiselmis virescens, Strain PCC157" /NCGR_SAMPLE_ID=MMETSP1356 /ASSEMBLY_ACC=CAM_ASM_000847 /LENGTH=122 /DNA_ID=CAMNT_0014360077 /DNA_START=450 /DNA_END=815 /DNA_ORIENTATION=-
MSVGQYSVGGCSSYFQFQMVLMKEKEALQRLLKVRCQGLARLLQARAGPCRCNGMLKNSHLYHTYRPNETPLPEYIETLLSPYADASTLAVCVSHSITRFIDASGSPLCRDQLPRLIAVAAC